MKDLLQCQDKDTFLHSADKLFTDLHLESLTAAQKEQVLQGALFDRLKTELESEVHKSKVDVSQQIEDWLSAPSQVTGRPKSHNTKLQYQKAIAEFSTYLDQKKCHHLEVSVQVADDYVVYLQKNKTAVSTQRLHIDACSSFYSYLERREHISRNHFRGVIRPKNAKKKSIEEVPTPATLLVILERLREDFTSKHHFRRQQAKYLYVMLHLFQRHGFRRGAIPTLSIDHETGFVKYTTKGDKDETTTFSSDTLMLLQEMGFLQRKPFAKYKPNSIWKAFNRICTRLFNEGKVPHVYTLHSIRHCFAIEDLKTHGSPKKTQRKLGHSNLYVTDRYLNGFEWLEYNK